MTLSIVEKEYSCKQYQKVYILCHIIVYLRNESDSNEEKREYDSCRKRIEVLYPWLTDEWVNELYSYCNGIMVGDRKSDDEIEEFVQQQVTA